MSEILSDTIETVTKEARKVVGVKCDVCGKVIPVNQRDNSKYYRVTTGHNEWGNDSCDSIEHADICPNCICNFVTEYLQNGNDSSYIDIETEHAYPYQRWE